MMQSFKKYFLSGLVVFLPLTLTIYLFIWTIQLAENLLLLLQSDSLRQQLATAGIAHVDAHFNIHKQCKKLEMIYQSLV